MSMVKIGATRRRLLNLARLFVPICSTMLYHVRPHSGSGMAHGHVTSRHQIKSTF